MIPSAQTVVLRLPRKEPVVDFEKQQIWPAYQTRKWVYLSYFLLTIQLKNNWFLEINLKLKIESNFIFKIFHLKAKLILLINFKLK